MSPKLFASLSLLLAVGILASFLPSAATVAAPVSAAAAMPPPGATGPFLNPNPPDAHFTTSTNNIIDLRTAGVYDPVNLGWYVLLEYNHFIIDPGVTVTFRNNDTRAPVVIRALNDVEINGTLSLDGKRGHTDAEAPSFSEPGPGGYRGGVGALPLPGPAGSGGMGPGGGYYPINDFRWGGIASHLSLGYFDSGTGQAGDVYGIPSLLGLVGGSGGSGGRHSTAMSGGGGAGGGALLLGSDTAIRLSTTGRITANGGNAGSGAKPGGAGSGGTIHLFAPQILGSAGTVSTLGGISLYSFYTAGVGSIEIQTSNPLPQGITFSPANPTVLPLGVFLPAVLPTVTLAAWRPAGGGAWNQITIQDPRAELRDAVNADVPLPNAGLHTIRIHALGVPLGRPILVKVVRIRGQSNLIQAQNGNASGITSTDADSWTDVDIDFTQGVTSVQVRAEL